MKRSLIPSLPHPIANALLDFLDEDLPRSADELSELFVALVEYLGAVALADYFDGHPDPALCAGDPSLNGWLVSQLATGKAEAGHWARWTQIAINKTTHPAVPCLSDHVKNANLDDPKSDLSWLLRFRNDVMHGGFVAPLPKIRQAIKRMSNIFDRLAPLWELRPVGCTFPEPDTHWHQLTGLAPGTASAPHTDREGWVGAGRVLLTDGKGRALLALDPGCTIDIAGHMHLQHEWKQHHQSLFGRPAIRAFFDRYQQERLGQIDDTSWCDQQHSRLPSRGYVTRPGVEQQLVDCLASTGTVVRLVGPVGSGRSTLASRLAAVSGRQVYVLPVEDPSVRMDPLVVRRWVLHTLSHHYLQTDAPRVATKPRPNSKERKIIEGWRQQMSDASPNCPEPILVLDDADLVGAGLYQGSETSGCLADARQLGASVLLIHRPGATPPASGDHEVRLTPWSQEELAAWGDPTELLATTGGHAELLAHPSDGLFALSKRVEEAEKRVPIGADILQTLLNGPATTIEVADAVGRFSPDVELTLRHLLEHLIEGERPNQVTDDGAERVYSLYPAVKLVVSAQGGPQ
jgi:hypothetical protein